LSEEEIVEKTKADMIVEAISRTSAPLVIFLIIFMVLAFLRGMGSISEDTFVQLVLSDAIVTGILKLSKE